MSPHLVAIISALFLTALGAQFYSDATHDPAKRRWARRIMPAAYIPLALGALGVGVFLSLWLTGDILISH